MKIRAALSSNKSKLLLENTILTLGTVALVHSGNIALSSFAPHSSASAYLLFLTAVAFSTWSRGLWSGITAMFFSVIVVTFSSAVVVHNNNYFDALIFLFVGSIIIFLIERLHHTTVYLMAQEKKKDVFISMASHELKTPLTSINAFMYVIIQRLEADKPSSETLTLAKRTAAQVQKMIILMNEMLDVKKLQRTDIQLNKTEFYIDDLINETCDELQLIAPEHKLDIKGKTTSKIKADRERIKQVLVNLITNAIKYSPQGIGIVIAIKQLKRHVEVSITDTGLGIPDDVQSKIFDLFYRADDKRMNTYPGLGIGLYIASQIIQRHHGKITVQSHINDGSTFKFVLPLYKYEKKGTNN